MFIATSIEIIEISDIPQAVRKALANAIITTALATTDNHYMPRCVVGAFARKNSDLTGHADS
jgi:hypothetical protein